MSQKISLRKTSACILFLLCSTAIFAVGPCQLNLIGDFNYDCLVDMDDLAVFASGWLTDWSGQSGAFLPPGIFVTPPEWGGSNSAGCGSLLEPCATISFGMYRAQSMGYSYVFVSDGIYSEAVTVTAGINLWGGFNPATWVRGDLQQSNTVVTAPVSGGHVKTLAANGIIHPTEVSGFVIQGAEATAAGKNSYAVWIRDCDGDFVLEQNQIYAGYGANGSDGAEGADGIQGVDGSGASGSPDKDYDAFITSSSPCSSSNDRQYDNGGVLVYEGDNISGGRGGGNQCAPVPNTCYSGIQGTAGQSSTSTGGGSGGAAGYAGYDGAISGSTCYLPPYPMTGQDGLPGADGAAGAGGIGAANSQGTLASFEWVGVWGSSGTAGGNGGGGGGGGAGGGSDAIALPYLDRLGAHGGGGGSGGVGGKGGYAGGAGGGSFGIFVVNTVAGSNGPTLLENTIIPGRGGDGGDGGFGGKGMPGGAGGPGGSCPDNCLCYSSAGNGGKGGAGGPGGGGGGGAGGVSYGLYTWNITGSLTYHLYNTFLGTPVGGTGGKGGKSLGNDGTDGIAGTAASYVYR